jgi:hypothetical protein
VTFREEMFVDFLHGLQVYLIICVVNHMSVKDTNVLLQKEGV